MKYEDHIFLAKYLFDKTVETKKQLKQSLTLNELRGYKLIDDERRKFYEELAVKLIKGLKIDFKNHPPF